MVYHYLEDLINNTFVLVWIKFPRLSTLIWSFEGIALFAVALGWLLLDIGWFVFFLETFQC